MRLILHTLQQQNMTTAASPGKWIFPVTELRINSKLIRYLTYTLNPHCFQAKISLGWSFLEKISLEQTFRINQNMDSDFFEHRMLGSA